MEEYKGSAYQDDVAIARSVQKSVERQLGKQVDGFISELRQERAQDEELVQDKLRTLSQKGKLGHPTAYIAGRASNIPPYNRFSALSPNLSAERGNGSLRSSQGRKSAGKYSPGGLR